MRFGVLRRPAKTGAVLLLALGSSPLAAEKTRCECPKPPGGSHGCEDQQIAYCKIKNGECAGWCGSMKTPKKRGEDLAAAIISESLQSKVAPRALREDSEYRLVYERFLESGSAGGAYEVIKGTDKIFVHVPLSTQEKIAALAPPSKEPPRERLHWWPSSPDSVMAGVDDNAITAKVRAKLAADGDINPFNIDVDTKNGVVTLQGRVAKEEARTKMGQLARDTDGVKRVINLIKVGDNG